MAKNKNITLLNLAPGCYTLQTMVVNPAPDRRVTRNWTCAAAWEAGMRLYVREFSYADDNKVKSYSIENVDSRWSHMSVKRSGYEAARWNALAAHMVPTDETLTYMIHRLCIENSFPYILAELINAGKLTLTDIESAYRAAMQQEE